MNPPLENNPIRHTHKIKAQMRQIIQHLREDVGIVTEAKAQALFETSAEVLAGLVQAFDDYEKNTEQAWRAAPMTARSKGSSPPCLKAKNPVILTNRNARRHTLKPAMRIRTELANKMVGALRLDQRAGLVIPINK
jgi:hypothetical protein